MQKRFIILLAPPGAGKSTQALLLKEKLETLYGDVIHLTTGGTFRQFIQSDSFIARRAKEEQNNGGLQPQFLAIWNWTNVFINNLKENTTVILDGAPRKVIEAEAMHNLFPFLSYAKPDVIYLEVTAEKAKERQLHRNTTSTEKREDSSTDEEIEKRITLFYEDTLPCVELFKQDPRYTFHRINGERTIEEIHQEILKALALS